MSDQIQNIRIKYIIDSSDVDESKKALQGLSQEEKNIQENFVKVNQAAKEAHAEVQKGGKESITIVSLAKDKVKELTGQFQVFGIDAPKAFNATKASVIGTSESFNVLKIAIASTGIGALVIALTSLVAYFRQTDDGATKLEAVMGALGAVIKRITGFLAEFGGKLFDALTSVEGFKNGLKELGEAIVQNIINRFTAVITYLGAFKQAFEGDFSGALKTAVNAGLQFISGVENSIDKLQKFGEEAAKAAKEAYDYAVQLDSINDRQRELNVTLAKNEQQVAQLIVQAKNKTLSEQESIALLEKANKLEEEGLKSQLALENERLQLIQSRNEREQAAINQRLQQQIAEAKTEEEKNKLREKQLSINDDLAQEEADQRKKIIDLETASIALRERNQNRIDVLTEQSITKQLDNIKKLTSAEENAQKERYVNREIDEKELADNLAFIQYNGLVKQREFLIDHGRDVAEINKAIEDVLVQQRFLSNKEKQRLDEEAYATGLNDLKKAQAQEENLEKQKYIDGQTNEEQFQENLSAIYLKGLLKQRDYLFQHGKETVDIDKQIQDELVKNRAAKYKEDEKNAQEAEQRKRQLYDQSVQIATTIVNGFFQLQQENYNNDLQALQTKQQQELAAVGDNKQAQSVINAKFARQEAEIKRKQAVADKEAAIFNIGISTASAIIKQLAATPLPVGAPLVAAVAAAGAVQLAFAAAKPIPKFNRGTKSVPGIDGGDDSVLAMLRPGEGVMPVDRMNDYRPAFEAIFDRRVPAGLINSIVMDYDQLGRMIPVSQTGSSGVEKHLKDMSNKLDKLQVLNVTLDKKGFRTYIESGQSKTEIENNYLRVRK